MVMRLISLLLRNQKRVFAVEDVPAPPATTEQISDFVQNRVVVLVDNVAEVKVVNNGNHEFNKYKAIEQCPRDKIINKKKLKSRMN